ncbi:MAG: iron-sulfur cluster insertion protein ErpA [Rhodospirillaceae bacterium]|jgi:iron-sulfur cluster insertion protein|nr:iron-sulfur cluster insertion protein ErpA [Rhodospirillaceae bacterium]MBT5456492.1 iron-sulfur cluster insertion protein ErpA [Rhodospirillaceae bacterium]
MPDTTEVTAENTPEITGVTISESAVKRISAMTAEGEFQGMMLRVSVSGGGCSGFQYGFTFDDEKGGDDHVLERDGVTVLIDDMSWEFVTGSELHFAEELIGSYFTMRNPNAASTCGCGVSFSMG